MDAAFRTVPKDHTTFLVWKIAVSQPFPSYLGVSYAGPLCLFSQHSSNRFGDSFTVSAVILTSKRLESGVNVVNKNLVSRFRQNKNIRVLRSTNLLNPPRLRYSVGT